MQEILQAKKQSASPFLTLADSFQIWQDSGDNIYIRLHKDGDPGQNITYQVIDDVYGVVPWQIKAIPDGTQTITMNATIFTCTPDEATVWDADGGFSGQIALFKVDNTAGTTVTFNTNFTDVTAIGAGDTGIQTRLVYYDGSTWREIQTGGGKPAGADTHVQFNDGGSALGGDAGFTYDKTTDEATLAGALKTPSVKAKDGNGVSLTEDSGTYGITVEDDGDIIIKLGDDAGARKITIQDSEDNTVAEVNSDGNIKVYGTVSYNEIYDNGNSGANKEIDWTKGNKQMIATTDNCTLTFVPPPSPCTLQLFILHENSTSTYTYTFPAELHFFSGYSFVATPNIANAVDILSIAYLGIVGKEYIGLGNNNA